MAPPRFFRPSQCNDGDPRARIQGPQYGLWENDDNDTVTGHTREYPEFKGVFDKVDWMRLNLTSGATLLLDLKSGSRVGVLRPSNKEVLPGEDAADFGPDTAIWDYPEAGGLFLFHKAPAIGTKLVKSVDELGRQSEPETLSGPISGSAVFRVW